MDYSQLSDQEINMLVAKIQHPDKNFIESKTRPPSVVLLSHINNWVDYCNNPADAWPIIEANGIGLRKQSNALWCATRIGGEYPKYDKNPLRAAMIVFLQMQDANNV